ncbi:uncharacterized protein LOC116127811 [Pistacia vera]|uniref:uncharacterized protein LOC116127811 n=1 Tax=Pistacia vera TaxID=55513 RepID=UPI0012637646|nr:uncharacterized protein LOC116127811 [Pistacia vera]
MQDRSMPSSEEILNPKPRKKKMSSQKEEFQKGEEHLPLRTGQKASKRNLKNEVSSSFQLPERSNSDSVQDSSTSGNEYRVLRRKYLLLEEESYALGRELRDVEDEVKTLEDDKHALLDQLVVLEGLIDPLEVQSQGPQFP